jgi:hypothetical protein
LHEQLRLERRLNLILYLNEDWDESWGGGLGLWSEDMKREVVRVIPAFNRCVVFSTDARSFHGHPDPLKCPDDVKRRSVALYYYTASDSIFEEVKANSTIYHARGGDGFADHLSAVRARAYSFAKDWIPPAIFRFRAQLRKREKA